MTIAAVADTHAALWFLRKVPRPSTKVKAPIDDAAARQHTVAISSIIMIEVVYLIEKGRIPASAYTDYCNQWPTHFRSFPKLRSPPL